MFLQVHSFAINNENVYHIHFVSHAHITQAFKLDDDASQCARIYIHHRHTIKGTRFFARLQPNERKLFVVFVAS